MTARVILGDWRDALPGTYDPLRAVVITDPPYGLAAGGGLGVRAPGSHFGLGIEAGRTRVAVDKGYEDVIPWSQHVRDVIALLPAKRYAFRGPATMLIRRDHPQPRRVCVEVASYRKRAVNRPGVVPYLWQGWAIYGRLRIEHHARAPMGDAIASSTLLQRHEGDGQSRRSSHRAITPYAAAAWIVDQWVDPGDIVIDPFAGHGTIGRAARMLGFDYLGAEIVPEFAAVAAESFESERLTMGLVG